MAVQKAPITTEYITLDAFLKWVGLAATGGHAKTLIADGAVKVDGLPELRRGRKLRPGDRISVDGAGQWEITKGEEG
ncbi:MAG TPA: RNA-binding S4 domain-containing protein [Symbiobacteriaceae bacterium]|jgi:ribosome-associated protein